MDCKHVDMNWFIFCLLLLAHPVSSVNDDDEDHGQVHYHNLDESEVTFAGSFVHSVTGFHDNDLEEEEDDESDLQRPAYLEYWKFKRGWKRHPLFLIILGG